MTGLADRMCKAGLAERRRDELDGRAMRLHLTGVGREKRLTARRGLEQINRKISEAEIATHKKAPDSGAFPLQPSNLSGGPVP